MRDRGTVLEYRPRDAAEQARALPANVELEQQFLGALLISNDIFPMVSGYLKPEHFSEEIHRRIYTLSASLIGDGRVASPVTLKTFLGEHDVGGGLSVPQYLARLVADASAPRCAPDYGRAICDLAARREIIETACAAIEQARDAPVDMKPPEISSNAIAAFQAIVEASSDGQTRVHPGDAAAAVLERARAILAGEKLKAGVPTGLPDLDMRTGGFNPGELWVVGGRPGQGKTVLATGFARKTSEHGARLMAAGEQGLGALLFSLELPKDQLIARLLSDLAYRPRQPITYGQIMRGELAPEDIDRLEQAREHLERLPLAIDVAPALSVAEIASRVRAEKDRMRRRNMRLSVVFIDYLKFVRATDRYRGLRVYEIGEITGALKQLAKSEDICVVLLVQANRGVEARDRKDRRPGMADLRDSGDIEADADVVAFIYREAVYIKQTAEFVKGDTDALMAFNEAEFRGEIIVSKTRSGPTGTVEIWIDAGASTFASSARGDFQ
jgi:replicative DNA helicase